MDSIIFDINFVNNFFNSMKVRCNKSMDNINKKLDINDKLINNNGKRN